MEMQENPSTMSKVPATPDIFGEPLCIFCSYRCNRGILPRKPKSTTVTFNCRYCCSVFSFHSVLTQHLMTHSKEMPHKCTRCEYRTHSQMILTGHMKTKHRMCTFCNQAFDTKAQFDRHWKTNCYGRVNKKSRKIKNFNNPTAETATKSRENFENKMDVAQKPSGIFVGTNQSHEQKVDNWNNNFTSVNTVQEQPSTSENCNTNLCTLCNYNCNRGIVSDDPEINSKALACFHCCSRFLKSKERQNHMNTHTTERPYKLEDCDFRTANPFSLENHHLRKKHMKGYLSNKAFLKNQDRSSFRSFNIHEIF